MAVFVSGVQIFPDNATVDWSRITNIPARISTIHHSGFTNGGLQGLGYNVVANWSDWQTSGSSFGQAVSFGLRVDAINCNCACNCDCQCNCNGEGGG